MSEALSALRAPIDPGLGGVLLANMLASLARRRSAGCWPPRRPGDESQDSQNITGARPAYIYLRQSTPGQVRHHQESTERQYALREKARELGWSESLIRTLDRDLGKTGTEMTGREDFKTLVADVSMGQVGAVFALEVSRLARSNLDWHRLLELCALTATLVIDEDGCYDPADFNDGLLLGLKGAMAQAELHFLHARLQGGKLNKAKKGELRFPLPVGFCYDEESRIILDPDEEVRGAVSLVFRLFRETGSAFAVMQRFAESTLRFPKRSYGGAWDGKLIWGRLTHGRVLGMLKNPSYAGMYVFGRYQYRREISPEGEVHKRMQAVAMPDWRVSLKDHHEGYISWEEFLHNQERLEKNRTNGEETVLAGPAREGLALFQGLLLCGTCGRGLTVRYTGNGGIYPCYQCNWLRREGLASKDCLSFRCDLLDAAIAEEVLKALQPAELELALAALAGVGVARSDHLAPMADADRTRRVRSGARRAALSGSRSLPASGGGHAGAALERCAAAVGRPQKTSRGVSASRSPRGHPRAEGESPRAGQGFTAGVACPHHAGQGPQADVAAAPQGYYGREALPSEAALGSPPLAGRRLHRHLRATPAQYSRPRAVSCRSCRPSSGSGPQLTRCGDRRSPQSRRAGQRHR